MPVRVTLRVAVRMAIGVAERLISRSKFHQSEKALTLVLRKHASFCLGIKKFKWKPISTTFSYDLAISFAKWAQRLSSKEHAFFLAG